MSARTGRAGADDVLAVFAPIDDRGRADLVADRLSDAIILGVLRTGDRLPSEATLGQQLGVATMTVREALDVLRSRGLIATRRGRGGGSFVTYSKAFGADDLLDGLDRTRFAETSRADLRDMSIHYAALLGAASSLAAMRASPTDLARLYEVIAEIRYDDEISTRRGEGTLRIEVAAISQSPRLVKEEARLQTEYGPMLWVGLRDPHCRAESRRLHSDLAAAISAADASTAADIAERHVELLATQAIRFKAELDRRA